MASPEANGLHGLTKPTISGFSPDPSICVIEGVFYLVTSSFHLFPGLPIYCSKDLQCWKLVGHAIHRPDQISLRNSDTELPNEKSNTIATGGLWAPTIRHHAGITYIICTNVVYRNGRTNSVRKNFIVQTTDIIACQWSDPMYFEFDGIDPSLFFDDNGKTYAQVCAHPQGGIWQFEIDTKTAQPLTTPQLLWKGWDRRFTEGPHVYKKDGYYYLLVAEGGTFEDHMISMARSKSIHGPFDSCTGNPLLTSRGTRNYIQHTGHGDFFQDGEGNWWTVVLAVRGTRGHYPLGRETFLTRVDWPDDEWPTIRDLVLCDIVGAQNEKLLDGTGLVHLRDADLSKYKISERTVTILASAANLSSHKDTFSFAGRRQRCLEGSSSVALRTPPDILVGSLRAGICVYKDEHRFAAVGLDFSRGAVYFEARNMAIDYCAEASMVVLPGKRTDLCIYYTDLEWSFQYRIAEDQEWVKIGVVDTLQLSGRDFTGPIIGIFAVGTGGCENYPVQFDAIQL